MPKYKVRYKYSQGPEGADDAIEVEAAMFITDGKFVDFYSQCGEAMNTGALLPRGQVVFRVADDILADVMQLPESD